MASEALIRWETEQAAELDRMEATHQAIGGKRPGRRWRIQHMIDAYILLLAAHFQRFARSLHDEACFFFAKQMPGRASGPVERVLLRDRKLDRGNAQPGSLGDDFDRLGMELWPILVAQNPLNEERRVKLEQLNVWRNAIAHQDLPLPARQRQLAGSSSRTLADARGWRSACDCLAREMDRAVSEHLGRLLGTPPW